MTATEKKLNALLKLGFVVMAVCLAASIYGTSMLYKMSKKPQEPELPGFVLPQGWKRVPGTMYVVHPNHDTLEIKHTVKHQYSYGVKAQ